MKIVYGQKPRDIAQGSKNIWHLLNASHTEFLIQKLIQNFLSLIFMSQEGCKKMSFFVSPALPYQILTRDHVTVS